MKWTIACVLAALVALALLAPAALAAPSTPDYYPHPCLWRLAPTPGTALPAQATPLPTPLPCPTARPGAMPAVGIIAPKPTLESEWGRP